MAPVDYVVQKGWTYKRRGTWLDIRVCPFCKGGKHNDLHTFAIHSTDGNYVCKRGTCNEKGNFDKLQSEFGDKPDLAYKPPTKTKISYQFPKTKILPPTSKVYDYLYLRGFSNETIQECGILTDKEDNVIFPYVDCESGLQCMLKFRHSHKYDRKVGDKNKAWREPGGKPVLWRLNEANPINGPLVITFGEFDAMTLVECKIPNSTSVPSGDDDLGWITLDWNELERYSDIILWPDNDESGQRALHEAARRLGIHRVRVVETEHKDANEMFYRLIKDNEGKENSFNNVLQAIKETIEFARPYPYEEVIRVADIPDEPVIQDGVLSNIRKLNQITGGWHGSELTLWSGDNHAGKTNGILSAVVAPALGQGESFFVYSGEMKKSKVQYWTELILAGPEYLTQKVSERTDRIYWEIDQKAKMAMRSWYFDNFFLYDKQGGTTEDSLFDAMEFSYQKYGCKQFLIDNLMIMIVKSDEKDEYKAQTKFATRCKQFADDFNVHVHLVAHSRKSGDESKPPTKSAVKGASELSNLADNAGAFWRVPEEYKMGGYSGVDTIIAWWKTRDSGEQANIKLLFNKASKRFTEKEYPEMLNNQYGWVDFL